MQVRIDVAVVAEFVQDVECLRQGHAGLVGAVARGERFEDVGDAHHPRLPAHLLARQAARVVIAVHALMVAASVLENILQVIGPRQLLEHLDRRADVVVDGLALHFGLTDHRLVYKLV